MYAVALYPCVADTEEDISFEAGDIILDVKQDHEGWCRGTSKSNGKRGLFPSNYVEFREGVPRGSIEDLTGNQVYGKNNDNVPYPPFMDRQQFEEYCHAFNDKDTDKDGFLSGAEVKPIFSESGLPKETLGRIWNLCDSDKTGKLNLAEFCIGLYLISEILLKNLEIPSKLQPIQSSWIQTFKQSKNVALEQPKQSSHLANNLLDLDFSTVLATKPSLPSRLNTVATENSEFSSSKKEKPPVPQRQLSNLSLNSSVRIKPPVPQRQPSTQASSSPQLPKRAIQPTSNPPISTTQKPQSQTQSEPNALDIYNFSKTSEGKELIDASQTFAQSEAGKKTASFVWDNRETVIKAAQSEQGKKAMSAAWNNRSAVASGATKGLKFANNISKP